MESDDLDIRNLREWQPVTDVLLKIPTKIQKGLFFQELNITCIDALPEFLALGSDVGIIFWYNRNTGNTQKLRTEVCNYCISLQTVKILHKKEINN